MVYCGRCPGAALSPQASPAGIFAVATQLSEQGHLNSSRRHPKYVCVSVCTRVSLRVHVACASVSSPIVWIVNMKCPVTISLVNCNQIVRTTNMFIQWYKYANLLMSLTLWLPKAVLKALSRIVVLFLKNKNFSAWY